MMREHDAPGLRAALRPLLALALLAAAIFGAAPARAADAAPTLSLRLWTSPSEAMRGDVVSYEILIDNIGEVRAERVRVTLPFSGHMKVVHTEFDHRATWVSELTGEQITVMFGRLLAGQNRRAKIFFEVGQSAPDGMQVRVRATGRYEGDRGEKVRSNYTTLVVGGQEVDTSPKVTVDQAAVASGTRLRFAVSNYFPSEKIFTWLNTSSGVRETKLFTTASDEGAAELLLNTSKLSPGAYSLVVYGESSKISTVVPFTIQ